MEISLLTIIAMAPHCYLYFALFRIYVEIEIDIKSTFEITID